MTDQSPSSTPEHPLSDKPSRESISAGFGAIFGALVGGAIGWAVAGIVGALIGAVIGAAIVGLIARMLAERKRGVRSRANSTTFTDWQATTLHPNATTAGGTSRSAADISRVRRSEDAATSTSTQPAWNRVDRSGAFNVTLAAEQLEVDKRELDAGLVRLRKIVKTEVVHVPVELRREEIVVERVEPGSARSTDSSEVTSLPIEHTADNDLVIPLVREEPVVQKQAKVFSEVHVHKVVHTETQHVHGAVRSEDVVVDHDGSTRKSS